MSLSEAGPQSDSHRRHAVLAVPALAILAPCAAVDLLAHDILFRATKFRWRSA